MVGETSTIVPANRLGQLLAEARLGRGQDLEELARRSNGEFTVGELSDLEAGHRLLDEQLIVNVTSLYEVGCGPIIPQRAELTIDLTNNLVSASGKALPLQSDARDHILDRYLSLLYVLRNREPGTEVPLRGEDLDILAASLAERAELIEEQLLAVMGGNVESVNRLTTWFRNRLWVPGAGALVGVVSIGTLVMVTSESSDVAISTRPDRPQQLGAVKAPDPLTVGTPRTTPLPDATRAIDVRAATGVQEMGEAAEALLPFDWRQTLPGWTINYRTADPAFRGLTFPYDRTIDIYVRSDDDPSSLAGILAHEIGHAIDVEYFGDAERTAWLRARNAEQHQWWPDAYANDFETGAGDFAEAVAFWAVGDASSSRIGAEPNRDQVELLEELLAPYV